MQADRNEACKHFAPKFPETGNTAVDVSLSLASKLNMAFCFQKRTAGPNVGPSKPTQGDLFRSYLIRSSSPTP